MTIKGKNKYYCENYPHMKGLDNIFVKYMQSLNIHVPIQNYKVSKGRNENNFVCLSYTSTWGVKCNFSASVSNLNMRI